jgi:polysaccharide biosynthesis/export protein
MTSPSWLTITRSSGEVRRLRLSLGLMLWFGCAHPAVTSKPLPSPVQLRQQEVLDPELFADRVGERDGDAYRVGAGDTLLVAVYGHPELSLVPYGGGAVAGSGARPIGFVIDNDGTIQFPLIGAVLVAGKTSAELRDFLIARLGVFVKDPQVTVQVMFNGSIRYYLLGEFTSPGLKYSDRPLRLLEALALGGTVNLQQASLRRAYVARNGKRLPISFQRLMREGDLRHNIRLRTGDVVFVPDNTSETAFVFGGSPGSNTRGGSVPFLNGKLDILQALAQAGFGFRERAQGKLSQTLVIRSEGDRGELFVVNVAKILQGEAAPFLLAPGDVVYVPASGVTTWNQALEQLLPSLRTISGLLAPFVQIKYLSE